VCSKEKSRLTFMSRKGNVGHRLKFWLQKFKNLSRKIFLVALIHRYGGRERSILYEKAPRIKENERVENYMQVNFVQLLSRYLCHRFCRHYCRRLYRRRGRLECRHHQSTRRDQAIAMLQTSRRSELPWAFTRLSSLRHCCHCSLRVPARRALFLAVITIAGVVILTSFGFCLHHFDRSSIDLLGFFLSPPMLRTFCGFSKSGPRGSKITV